MEREVNLDVIKTGNASVHDNLIDHGQVLIAFADAIVGTDPAEITVARNALVDAMGELAMVDAAGVAANFQRMVRIADSTGIPLGAMEDFSAEVRRELELEEFLQ